VLLGGELVNGLVALDASRCSFEGVPGRAGLRNFEGCTLPLPVNAPERLAYVLDQAEVDTLSKLTAEVPTLDEQGRPLDVGGSGGTDLTYFARLALIKDWENLKGSLVYERANSDSAVFGSSSVSDSLKATLTWTPRQLWTLSLAAGISQQEQATDQVVPTAYQLVNAPAPAGVTSVTEVAQVQSLIASTENNAQQYLMQSATFSASRQLTPHSFVFTSLYWYTQRQDVSQASSDVTRWNNLTLWVGLDWTFDPIRF
jgi:hypothetical protein